MLINKTNLENLRVSFRQDFQGAFDRAPTYYQELCTTIPSGGRANVYGFLQQQMKLREWVGPRDIRALEESDFRVVNRKFQESIEVRREDIEDDTLQVYSGMLFPQLGEATRKFPDQLLRDQLQSNAGAGPTAFDGLSMFSTARDYGGGTIDNLDTAALTADNLEAAWAKMASYVDMDGEPLGAMGNTLFVAPQLRREAEEITSAATRFDVAGGSYAGSRDNVLSNWGIRVIVVPELANEPGIWYLADTSKPIKPVIFQERTSPELVSRTDLDDPKVFDEDVFVWGVRYRCEIAPGPPHLIYKSGT